MIISTFPAANNDADAVTMDGGAVMTADEVLGTGPYTIEITPDEDASVGAEIISYNNKKSGMTSTNVQTALDEVAQDIKDESAATDAVQTNLETHIADTEKHITADERAAWNAKENAFDVLPISKGGTGASTAEGAIEALGISSGGSGGSANVATEIEFESGTMPDGEGIVDYTFWNAFSKPPLVLAWSGDALSVATNITAFGFQATAGAQFIAVNFTGRDKPE